MNGAEALVRTMVQANVDVSFTNPGTSEMHFVAALDRVDGMRCVLCLFEGGATGAADGYARMTDKPAATLLHLGPGLANGMANIHNARRAGSPMLNIVGEHTSFHKRFDAPLTSDIEALARPFSHFVRTGSHATTIAQDGADAIVAARSYPGKIATLILPADTAWGDSAGPVKTPAPRPRQKVDEACVRAAAEFLRSGSALLLIGDVALRDDALASASRIAQTLNCRIMAPMSNKRMARGIGRVPVERVPYPVDMAVERLKDIRRIVLAGAKPPVAFFGYPGKPSALTHPDCEFFTLAENSDDLADALARLADHVDAGYIAPLLNTRKDMPLPTGGALTPDVIGPILGALLPDNAVVCDESVSTGRNFFASTHHARPHDWLQITGGAIGIGIPLATGAAVGAPDRKIINLQADGSAMYTVQALWTQARENLNVLTVIWANREYAILRGELANVGAANPGRKAHDMLSLDNPPLNWVSLANGMGVEAVSVDTVEGFIKAMQAGIKINGPYLIEVLI